MSEALRRARARLEIQVRRAREDPIAFFELFGKTQKGEAYRIQPFQRNWIEAISKPRSRVLIAAPPEHGKTELISRLWAAWQVGKHPEENVALVKSDKFEAEKAAATVRTMAFENELYSRVFPDVKPARGRMALDRQAGFRLDGSTSQHLTFQAFTWSAFKSGPRVNTMIVDDVLDFDNTRTPGRRKAMIEKWNNIFDNRIVEDGRAIFLTNTHHPQDLAHELMKNPEWTVIVDSAVVGAKSAEGWVSDKEAFSLWPEQWSIERLLKKLTTIGPLAFGFKFLNISIDEATQRFRPGWIARCLERGRGLRFRPDYDGPAFIGIDPGTRPDKDSDLTVFFVYAAQPDGSRLLLDMESGRFGAPELLSRLRAIHGRFPRATIYPESNAAQAWIAQFGADIAGIPIVPHVTTGSNKWDESWGVESLAVELFNGRWILPSGEASFGEDLHSLAGLHPELKALIEEMLLYRPDAHTGDRLMAMWIAREGMRLGAAGTVKFNAMGR